MLPTKKMTKVEAKSLNIINLAFIGDAVYSLYIRQKLLSEKEEKPNDLNKASSALVCAEAQSGLSERLLSVMTEEEVDIFRRGRNAKSHLKKNATVAVYHASTGFEALLGFYYLKGEQERLEEIVEAAFWFIVENYVEE